MPAAAQVLLKYRHKHFDVGWGITNTPWHIYRLLTQFGNALQVSECPDLQRHLACPLPPLDVTQHRRSVLIPGCPCQQVAHSVFAPALRRL